MDSAALIQFHFEQLKELRYAIYFTFYKGLQFKLFVLYI